MGCAVLVAGCISPRDTRLPTLRGNPNTRAEGNSYGYVSPLPEPTGALFYEQPRGFEFPRALPKRVQDASAETDIRTGRGGAVSTPAASRYPQSVNP